MTPASQLIHWFTQWLVSYGFFFAIVLFICMIFFVYFEVMEACPDDEDDDLG